MIIKPPTSSGWRSSRPPTQSGLVSSWPAAIHGDTASGGLVLEVKASGGVVLEVGATAGVVHEVGATPAVVHDVGATAAVVLRWQNNLEVWLVELPRLETSYYWNCLHAPNSFFTGLVPATLSVDVVPHHGVICQFTKLFEKGYFNCCKIEILVKTALHFFSRFLKWTDKLKGTIHLSASVGRFFSACKFLYWNFVDSKCSFALLALKVKITSHHNWTQSQNKNRFHFALPIILNTYIWKK